MAGDENLKPDSTEQGAEEEPPVLDGPVDDLDDDEHTFTVDEEPLPMAAVMPKEPVRLKGAQHGDVRPPQGMKRKSPADERQIDPDATTALMLSDLHWWTTEDEIRSWTSQAHAEGDLREISFSEHKVNGKSKGQAYLLFDSPAASTAVKHTIEGMIDSSTQSRKFPVSFASALANPFKTLPKDTPARNKDERSSRGAHNNAAHSDRGSGFRGRGRGHDRGGFNRNFSGPAAGTGFNNSNLYSGPYGNSMNAMNGFGFNNRGSMVGNGGRAGSMSIRGGRGGNMNNMMAMGHMGMPSMPMNPMTTGMAMQGFPGNQFGPTMFPQAGFGGEWAQSGVKRQRQE